MKDETNRVIDPLVITKCVVTTLVSNDPNTCQNAALESPIDGPSKELEVFGEEVEISGGYIAEERDQCEVVDNI